MILASSAEMATVGVFFESSQALRPPSPSAIAVPFSGTNDARPANPEIVAPE